MLEDLLMTVQRSLHLGAVGGIAVQNLIVSDQALGTLGQEDLVTEFHRWRCLPRLIRCVWDSKMEYTFSSGGTCSPSSTRRRVWLMTFSPRSQYAVICWRSWSIATPPSTSTPLTLAVFLTTWRALSSTCPVMRSSSRYLGSCWVCRWVATCFIFANETRGGYSCQALPGAGRH